MTTLQSTGSSTKNWRHWPVKARRRLLEKLQALPAPADSCLPDESARTDPVAFAGHCRIKHDGSWIPFALWPCQAEALAELPRHKLNIWLKPRQVGMSCLALALALQTVLFSANVTVLLFSLRDDEAVDLLNRLKEMYDHLPDWLQAVATPIGGNTHQWKLSNGSRVLAFPTSAGDSYTAKLAIVDEADLVPDLDRLLGSVKPTIDAGGKLLLLSRSNKAKPNSAFKRIFRAAQEGKGGWHPTFFPWSVHPDRDAEWYRLAEEESLTRTGSLDSLFEQYPASPEQALSAASLDKRFPLRWVEACSETLPVLTRDASGWGKPPLPTTLAPPLELPGLTLYEFPQPGHDYVIGADTAEGIPNRDLSAACVLDRDTGCEVATLSGALEPAVFGAHLDALGRYYGDAPLMVERNNHGHAVLLWLREHAALGDQDTEGKRSKLRLLNGHDKRPGWLTSTLGKTALLDLAANCLRTAHIRIRSPRTRAELISIEGRTLKAPEGEHDDQAIALMLALQAVIAGKPSSWKDDWRVNF